MEGFIKVHKYKGSDFIESKDLSWPQQYEDFIKDIIKNFNLNQNMKVMLKLITEDEDTNNINSQDDLEDYLEENNIKEFHFSVEESKDLPGTGKIEGAVNSQDLEKLLDPNLFKEEEDFDVDDIMKEMFNNEEYKKKKEEDIIKYSNEFKQTLEKNVEGLLKQKSKEIEKEIDKRLTGYSEAFSKVKNETYYSIMDLRDNLNGIKEQTEEMSGAIKELLDSIQNQDIILAPAKNIEQIIKPNDNNDKKPNDKNPQMSGMFNPNPLNGLLGEEEDNKIGIKFEKKALEQIIDIKESKFINIDNIKIINVGVHSYKNLVFVKDKDNSSNDINFFGNYKNVEIHELTMAGEFQPNNTANFNFSLSINNPKPNQTYKLVIYVKEKNGNKNLSEPFEINIKINEAEDPIQQRQKQAENIYEELKNEYHDSIYLIDKNEIINQLLENNLNKEEIKESLNSKIEKIKENENNQKAEQLYNELNFYKFNFDKNKIIALIKNEKFNKENVQKWIDGKISEKIYEALSKLDEVDIKNVKKEDVLEKIKELNFNIDNLKETYKKKKIEDPAVIKPAGDENDEEVNKLYDELEEEYGISGFVEEGVAKQKIRDLELNKEKIVSWIENNLLNGENI